MLRRDIFVVGLPGTGKTTLAARLAQSLSTVCLNSGEALRVHLRRNGISLEDVVETGNVFLRVFGEEAAGAAILHEADAVGARIIDGPRLFSMLTYYQASGREVDVVYLWTNQEVRSTRFGARSIEEGEATPENVNLLLSRKDKWGGDLGRFAQVSRWRFDNSGPMRALLAFADMVASEEIAVPEPAGHSLLVGRAASPRR